MRSNPAIAMKPVPIAKKVAGSGAAVGATMPVTVFVTELLESKPVTKWVACGSNGLANVMPKREPEAHTPDRS